MACCFIGSGCIAHYVSPGCRADFKPHVMVRMLIVGDSRMVWVPVTPSDLLSFGLDGRGTFGQRDVVLVTSRERWALVLAPRALRFARPWCAVHRACRDHDLLGSRLDGELPPCRAHPRDKVHGSFPGFRPQAASIISMRLSQACDGRSAGSSPSTRLTKSL